MSAEQKILNVSHAHRCIFIHVPKAAGTSIKKVFGMDDSGGHPGWHWYAEKYPDVWSSYTSFAVVRNPWDRFVSSFRHAQMKNSYWHDEEQGLHSDYDVLANKTLDDCLHMLCNERERLRHPAWRAQTTWLVDLKGPERKIMVDHILRYEQLDADFARLCEMLGMPPQTLLTINRSKRSRDYRQYFNDQTRRLVELAYAADVATFGYSF